MVTKMSHFTVLVISKTIEDVSTLLAPYHEFECTGHDDQYIQNLDITEEIVSSYEDHKDEYDSILKYAKEYYGYKLVKFGKKPDLTEKHKYGYIELNEDGSLKTVIRRTNPNAQWDWYEIGGRWGGMLQPGGVNQILRKDLDLVAMLAEARKGKEEAWKEAVTHFSSKQDGEFLVARKRYKELLEELRSQQEKGVALHEMIDRHPEASDLRSAVGSCEFRYGIDLDTESLEAHVATAIPFSTYAVITEDGKWYEKGKMGWWGMSSNEKDENVWLAEFNKMLNEIPEDRWLTVVDCHI